MAPNRSERPRICLIAPSMAGFGGQSIMADRLVRGLRGRGHVEVDFVSIDQPIQGFGSVLQRIRFIRTAVTSIRYLGALLRRVPRADVVHVFSASYWSFLLAPTPAILVARLLGKPVILHYHSGEADDHLSRSRVAVRIAGMAQVVAVPSAYLAEVFGAHGLDAVVIPNHVDAEDYRHRERVVRPSLVLSNRNLEPLYNVGGLLDAFARVQERFPDTGLVVAGSGSQAALLRQQAKDLGLRNVRFVGSVQPSEMVDLLHAADVYLNASLIDNMPMSLLEAFASGLPVVSSDAGGIPFIVEHGRNGLLAPAGDPEALARQVFRVFEDPALGHRLAAEGRADCVARYGAPAALAAWEDLYGQAGGTGRRGPLVGETRAPTSIGKGASVS